MVTRGIQIDKFVFCRRELGVEVMGIGRVRRLAGVTRGRGRGETQGIGSSGLREVTPLSTELFLRKDSITGIVPYYKL